MNVRTVPLAALIPLLALLVGQHAAWARTNSNMQVMANTFVKIEIKRDKQVFDPKLQDIAAIDGVAGLPIVVRITKKPNAPANYAANVSLTILRGTTEIHCLVRDNAAWPDADYGVEKTFVWDGKWGIKGDGTGTDYRGKIANPGEYQVKLALRDNQPRSRPITTDYPLYVARLGITEVKFSGVGPADYFALQFPFTNDADKTGGIAQAANRFPVPATAGAQAGVHWRLGMDGAADRDRTVVDRSTDGAARSEEARFNPTTDDLLMPKRDTGVTTPEDDSYNYPVCYKQNVPIKVTVRTSAAGYSQEFNAPATPARYEGAAMGYSITNFPITLEVTWGTQKLAPQAAATDITRDSEYTFTSQRTRQAAARNLDNSVGADTLTLVYKWSYKDPRTRQMVTIPGQFTSTHHIYRVATAPKQPWDTEAPWIPALEFATRWVTAGAVPATNDPAVAAARVTAAINDGAGVGLAYDTTSGRGNYAAINAANPTRLGNFLLLLTSAATPPTNVATARYSRRQTAPGVWVQNDANRMNCADCGAMTTLFSNVLGADLRLACIDASHMLNPIIAIGGAGFARPFNGTFAFHAFAVTNANPRGVYDACLKVGRADPTNRAAAPGDRELPTGMRYVLATPATFANITPPGGGKGTVVINQVNATGDGTMHPVYWQSVLNGAYTVRCTAVADGKASFDVTCNRYGAAVLGTIQVADQLNVASAPKALKFQDYNLLEMVIKQGATARFVVGDTITFDTRYDYTEYRGSLAAADGHLSTTGANPSHILPKGRGAVALSGPYDQTLE